MAAVQGSDQGEVSLTRISVCNWLLLLLLTGLAWLFYTAFVALSVFVGGAIANLSFLFLKKDLVALLRGPLEAAKARFFMRYYLRLAVIVAVLFLLVKFQKVQIVGLLVGLSTVLLSIGLAVTIAVKKMYLKDF
ncbi:ATP synthase subunit I [Thiovibrio sp. JS02]